MSRPYTSSSDSMVRGAQPPPQSQVIIRTGPLWIGLATLFVIPMLFLSLSDLTLHDDSKIAMDYQHSHFGSLGTEKTSMTVGEQIWIPSIAASTSDTFDGRPSLRQNNAHSSNVVADSPMARCTVQTLSQSGQQSTESMDWIFFDALDRVLVVVLEQTSSNNNNNNNNKAESQWLLVPQERLAIPGGAHLMPLEAIVAPKESPFITAQRLVERRLGVDVMVKATITAVVDVDLPTGQVPDEASANWKFLGRFHNLPDHGGGVTYGYLFTSTDTVGSSDSAQYQRLSSSQLRNALLQQDATIADIRSVAILSLALQYQSLQEQST